MEKIEAEGRERGGGKEENKGNHHCRVFVVVVCLFVFGQMILIVDVE